jgi:ubiquinone/menaquinone biosynthesis C-methylase UbiE
LVLEFGCGLGRLTSWLAERTDRVVGVDISLPMVQLAQKAAQRSGRRNLLYTVIDGTVLPFRPSSFELVICCGSLKYIIEEGDLKSVVKEFTRILSENGECVVIDEMDDRGPTMLTGKEDLTGWAVARRPEEYVQLFAEHRMRVRNHFMFYRNTLVSRYNALNQRLSCFKNSGPDRFVSEMIASWDAILDSALRRRLRAGRGWHVLHLVRGIM